MKRLSDKKKEEALEEEEEEGNHQLIERSGRGYQKQQKRSFFGYFTKEQLEKMRKETKALE